MVTRNPLELFLLVRLSRKNYIGNVCIKIDIILVLLFNPLGLGLCWWTVSPEGPYSPVAKYFGTCLKIGI
jgi:hypothetical protein